MTESDDKPELYKVAELINEINKSSADDKEKTIQFKNALNNLLKLAKKLITLEIGRKYYEEYNNTRYYIKNNDKEYIFINERRDKGNRSDLDIYNSHIYNLKAIIYNLESEEKLDRDAAIDIIKRFRSISVVSPVYSQNIDNSLYREYSLYYDVLAEVQNEQQSKKANGGKRISKGKSNKVAKKPIVSQKKQSVYKEIFGKQMKIYKMPDSRKEYVKYKGELHPISEYKSLMKQKAMAKPKAKK